MAILARKAKAKADIQAKNEARSLRIAAIGSSTTYAGVAGGRAQSAPQQVPASNGPRSSNRPPQKEVISQSENIVQFFGTDFSQKCEKARTFGPIFQKIMASSGIDAAMSAWLLFMARNVQF